MRADREWQEFLAAQDPVWKRMPRTWYEGPFLGNGLLGSIVYQEPGQGALRFTVQHSEVQDHRPQFGSDWGVARLPVGNLLLHPVGAITGTELRLDLWNAEITGTLTTDKGTIRLRALVHNDRTLLLVTARADAGERTATTTWRCCAGAAAPCWRPPNSSAWTTSRRLAGARSWTGSPTIRSTPTAS
nr:hypothetical protein [Streptomyces blattellae]